MDMDLVGDECCVWVMLVSKCFRDAVMWELLNSSDTVVMEWIVWQDSINLLYQKIDRCSMNTVAKTWLAGVVVVLFHFFCFERSFDGNSKSIQFNKNGFF